jgi:hypothetical protein
MHFKKFISYNIFNAWRASAIYKRSIFPVNFVGFVTIIVAFFRFPIWIQAMKFHLHSNVAQVIQHFAPETI